MKGGISILRGIRGGKWKR